MQRLKKVFGPLTIPQLLLALVVFGGAVAGAYYGVGALREPDGGAAQADEQLVTASIGDIVKRVTINGATAFPEREWQAFEGEGVVGAVLVEEGGRVSAGDVIAHLDDASIIKRERRLAVAKSDLQKAEEALTDLLETEDKIGDAEKAYATALDDLDIALDDFAVKKAQWVNTLANAEEALADAEEGYAAVYRTWLGVTLTDGQLGATPDDLLVAWSVDLDALFQSTPGVHADSSSLPPDADATPWNEQTVASWTRLYPAAIVGTCEDAPPASYDRCVKSEMDAAWDAYRAAADALAAEQSKAASALFTADQAIVEAQNALETAEEALADAEAGPDPLAVSIAQADVALALLEVQESDALLEGAALRASISGVVNQVAVESGDALAPTGRVLEIVDPSVVEVEGAVDEIDILSIAEGAQAFVILEALAAQSLTGVIDSIGTGALNQQGVVSYSVNVRVDVPGGLQLYEGLSATAGVVVSETLDVLLIPTAAVGGSFLQPTVRVATDGAVEERSVTLGDSDDFWVAVASGLEEGEQVLMATPEAGGFFGFGGFGGGFGALGPGGLGQIPRGIRVQPSGQGGFNVTIGDGEDE